MTDILDSFAKRPGVNEINQGSEYSHSFALFLKVHSHFQHLSPLMRNQLSDLTYLPRARRAHGTGRGVIQKGTKTAQIFFPRD